VNLAFQQVLGWFICVLVGAAESVTDSVLHAVSDYHIYPRFHFLLFVCLLFQNGLECSLKDSSAVKTCLTALTKDLASSCDVNLESSLSRQ
jgi:hypothetical protein